MVVVLLFICLGTAWAQVPIRPTFQTSSYNAGANPTSVAIADFNHDSKADLVVANLCGDGHDPSCLSGGSVSVLFGNGDGTFQSAVSYPTGVKPYAVATGDFNGDGKPDLVTANSVDNTVSLLLNNGDGTFQAALSYNVGVSPKSVAVGDFNGDGKLDLATTDSQASGHVTVLLGNGDGTFQPAVSYPTGSYSTSVAVGDLNYDGKLDLVVANGASHDVSVLLGNGDGTFQPAVSYDQGSWGPYPSSVAIGDLGGEGGTQIVTAGLNGGVGLFANNGNGTFQGALNFPARLFNPSVVLIGDFNNDRYRDLIMVNPSTNNVTVVLNYGDGEFWLTPANFDAGTNPQGLAADDFNGDGEVDVAVADYGGGVTILLNTTGHVPAMVWEPAPNSTLVGGTFEWTANYQATAYRITAGSTLGGTQFYDSGSLPSYLLDTTVSNLPHDGSTVYVTMYSLIAGQWVSTASTYMTYDPNGVQLTNPLLNSELFDSSVTATWTQGSATAFQLDVGSTPGGNQYYQTGNLGNVLTATVSGLPEDGRTIYLTLYWQIQGVWYHATYPCFTFAPAPQYAEMLTPAPGLPLTDRTAVLTWYPGIEATAYSVDVGSTVGGSQYFHSGNLGNVTSTTVSALPVDGSPVYVTLYTQMYGNWYGLSYTYSAYYANRASGVITTPHPSSRLTGSSVPFTWRAGSGATAYQLDAGSTPGGNQYYQSGNLGNVLTTTVSGLPTDGSTVYVTLYSLVLGQWFSNSYTFTAYNAGLASSVSFLPPVNFDTGNAPIAVVKGDFNGDGKADVAVVNYYDNTLSVLLGNGDGTLQAAVNYPTGAAPYAIAVGDFRHSGKLDLAVANQSDNTVSILLGNGDGSFQVAGTFPAGTYPNSVAVGDFNGDGKLDLVTANQVDSDVSVLLGNGDGTFQSAVNYATGAYPATVVVGDFNHDGKLDLAVANESDSNFSVLLGNGNGTFAAQVTYNTGFAPFYMAVGDFNGDGKLDLAVSNAGDNNVSVFLGKGDGTFPTAANYPTGSLPAAIVVGDFNGDGHPDMIVANVNDNTVSSLVGNGDGTFTVGLTLDAGPGPISLAAADFSGDGKLDVAVADFYAGVSLLLSSAGGGPAVIYSPAPNSTLSGPSATFQWTPSGPATAYWIDVGSAVGGNQYYQSGSLPTSTLSATVTGLPTDGVSSVYVRMYSLIAGQWVHNDYTYTAFNGAAALGVLTTPPPGSTLTGSTVTFGWAAGSGAASYWLDIGSSPGGNQYLQSGSLGNVLTLSVSSLPTDGSAVYVRLYLLVGGQWLYNDYTYTAFNVASGQGVLTTPPPGSALTGSTVTFGWTAGTGSSAYWLDVGSSPGGNQYLQSGNLGNVLSLAVPGLPVDGSTVYVTLYSLIGGQWYHTGYTYTAAPKVPTFLPPVNYGAHTGPVWVAVGDFNGDHKPDLAVTNQITNDVSILLGNGDGTFGSALNYPAGSAPHCVAVGDFNHDGNLDLVVANSSENDVSVLFGNGDGTFQAKVNYNTQSTAQFVAVADLNGDGNLDLVVANGTVSVLLGRSDGTFGPAVNYGAGSNPWSVAVGDFNGDGKPDLAVANQASSTVSVLLGRGDGTFRSAVNYPTGSTPYSVAVGDFNGDGKADLVVANAYDNTVGVLLGKGDGTFQAAVNYGAGAFPASVAVADFNGDGKLDLLVADLGGNPDYVSVLVGYGNGTFQTAVNYRVGVSNLLAVAADLNGDGKPDVAVASTGSGKVSILLNSTIY
jgi:hypothetical protein